jgi:hypothetical protein
MKNKCMRKLLFLVTVFLNISTASAFEVKRSNEMLDFKWTYTGVGKSARLAYSIKNKTNITVTPIGPKIEIVCGNGSKETKPYPFVKFNLAAGESTEVIEIAKSINATPACLYSQGKVKSIKIIREVSLRQDGIRSNLIDCGSIKVPVIMSMDITKKNIFKAYTPLNIYTFNWLNIKAEAEKLNLLKKISIQEGYYQVLNRKLCGESGRVGRSLLLKSIFKYMKSWNDYCEKNRKDCIKQYKTVIGRRG